MPPIPAGFIQLLSSASEAWSLHRNDQLPTLQEDEVLVRNSYVGLNPFDWKGVKHRFSLKDLPSVLGRDGSGIIVSVGPAVTRLKQGDRIWFCANSAVPHSGAFQEYSVHKAEEVGLLPPNVSLRSGATLGTGLLTAAIVLFKCFQLSIDKLHSVKERTRGAWIFIASGSGSTGQYLIQLSRLLGLRIICTASKSNHQVLKALGADLVLDRHDSAQKIVQQIRDITNGEGVLYAVDNVGPSTVQLCRRILNSDPALPEAQLVALAGSPNESQDTERRISIIPISFSTTFFGHPEFSIPLLLAVRAMLETKSLRPSPYETGPGGLSGIKDALLRLEMGKVGSMRKLIVDVRGRRQKREQRHGVVIETQVVGVKRKATPDGEERRASKVICA